jgi:hypothetical protein
MFLLKVGCHRGSPVRTIFNRFGPAARYWPKDLRPALRSRSLTRPGALLIVALACLGLGGRAGADTRDEFWPELDLWFKLNDSFRLLLVTSGARDRDTGDRTNGEGAVYLDYRMNQHISLRGGFDYALTIAQSPGEQNSVEHRYILDFNYRWHFGDATQLTDRTRTDLRNSDGASSYRIRNRLQLEHEIKFTHGGTTPYANVEAYYDSRYDTVSRLRWEAGASTAIGKRMALDLYVGRQHDSHPQIQEVNGLGVTLNAYF